MGRGGMRWGAGRPPSKGKAEALMRLDARDLARRGSLVNGCSGTWRWTIKGTGEETGSIGYRVEDGALVLSYSLSGEPKTQHVPILATPCNYGGARTWLACPNCRARVALLYLRRGGFYCRSCARVAYYSQSEDVSGRSWQVQRKAEAKLGEYWARPKGMHETTHQRLLAIIYECEEQRDIELARFMATHAMWLK